MRLLRTTNHFFINVTCIKESTYKKLNFHTKLGTISMQPGWGQKRE